VDEIVDTSESTFCDTWRKIRASEKYTAGPKVSVLLSRQSVLRERNRAQINFHPWKFYFQPFVLPWTDVFIRMMLVMRWSLFWELNAFAKTVNLSVNWSVEITFVTSHDRNIVYFLKRDSWCDKEEIIFVDLVAI